MGPRGIRKRIQDYSQLTALAKENPDVRFYDGKIKTARYYCAYELPQVQAKAAGVKSSDMSALHILWEDEA